jgi:hypothetical protein
LAGIHVDPLGELDHEAGFIEAADGRDFTRIEENALGEEEPANEVLVVPRRAHDDRNRRVMESDLERIFDDDRVVMGFGRLAGTADDFDAAKLR